MTSGSPRVVSVEIHGQRYPVRSTLDAAYVAELAAFVDERMHAAAREVGGGDSVKLAVLVALNIADEYFRCRRAEQAQGGELQARAAALERLLDQVLAGIAAPPP